MGCRGVTGQHYSEILEYLHLKMLSFCHAAVSQAVRQKKKKKKKPYLRKPGRMSSLVIVFLLTWAAGSQGRQS